MIIEGVKLMLLGMGVVFVFLFLLYIVILFSSVALRSFTEKELKAMTRQKKEKVVSRMGSATGEAEDQNLLTAIITAAIETHRRRS